MNRIERKIRRFLDPERITTAIQRAEQQTSGEIRVSIAPFFIGNIQKAAERAFRRLGMDRTQNRNGALIFMVPSRRRFVVLGDEGIHQRVGQSFWNTLVTLLSTHFRRGDFTGGLEAAIEEIGRQLSMHFPYDLSQDRNELSNAIDIDPAKE